MTLTLGVEGGVYHNPAIRATGHAGERARAIGRSPLRRTRRAVGSDAPGTATTTGSQEHRADAMDGVGGMGRRHGGEVRRSDPHNVRNRPRPAPRPPTRQRTSGRPRGLLAVEHVWQTAGAKPRPRSFLTAGGRRFCDARRANTGASGRERPWRAERACSNATAPVSPNRPVSWGRHDIISS
jgi:hypothetical protein